MSKEVDKDLPPGGGGTEYVCGKVVHVGMEELHLCRKYRGHEGGCADFYNTVAIPSGHERRARIRERATAIYVGRSTQEWNDLLCSVNHLFSERWDCAYTEAEEGEQADARFLAAERKEVQ